MSHLFPEKRTRAIRPQANTVWLDQFNETARRYARAREYCGFSLDQLINSGGAQRYLQEVWLVSCMVRKPEKASSLPPGNPFRERNPAGRRTVLRSP